MKEIIKKEIELNRKTTESLLSGETVSAIEEAAKMIISSLGLYYSSGLKPCSFNTWFFPIYESMD